MLFTVKLKDAWDLGARGLSHCVEGQLEGQKPWEKISEIDLSSMKKTRLSACDRESYCYSDIILFIFISTMV
jgi:hypothetical protein